jgi:tetratricopeptide (TPR) repeat protein
MPLILPLTPDDETRLRALLAEQGRTILERQSLLESAGLAGLLPKIDLNTPAEQFAEQTVRVAQRYGAVAPGEPALFSLLRVLQEAYAGQPDSVAFLTSLLALPSVEAELPPEEEPPPTISNTITGTQGDVIVANVVVDKESKVALDVTVGKNIIKIGKIVIPIWMFMVALALPFLLSGGAYWAFVPAKMPNNAAQFNVAVATFGELRNGRVETSDTATLLSQWVAEGLTQEKPVYEEAFGNPIEVWHDGLSPLVKRTTIGMIEGSNQQIRQGNAEERAFDLNANVLIYGVLETQSNGREALTIEFYVKPDLSLPIEARFGHERMGDPIVLPATFDPTNTGTGDSAVVWETVNNRGRALAWIARALDRERRGLRSEMIAVIERAEDAANSTETGRLRWPEQGAGKEVIYTLKGEAQLELAHTDRDCGEESQSRSDLAQAAFESAVASNDRYVLAHIGLGYVAHYRAQCLLTIAPVDQADREAAAPFVETARAHFARAQQLITTDDNSEYVQAVVALSIPSAERLFAFGLVLDTIAEPERRTELLAEALDIAEEAIATLETSIAQFPDDEYYHRLAARGYLSLANLAQLKSVIYQALDDTTNYEASIAEAVNAYTLCEAEANLVFADVYLHETLIPDFCTPQKEQLLQER